MKVIIYYKGKLKKDVIKGVHSVIDNGSNIGFGFQEEKAPRFFSKKGVRKVKVVA